MREARPGLSGLLGALAALALGLGLAGCAGPGAADPAHVARAEGLAGTGLETGGDGEDGVGGTGLAGDEEGIGGTGVVGTITGFGSVWVNGMRIPYDPDVPVDEDGVRRDASALAVGQVVAIEARGRGDELHAERISIRHAVVGPVTHSQDRGRVLHVMGQRVDVPDGARVFDRSGKVLGRWALGRQDFVAVSGHRRGDGAIVASRIDRREPSPRVSVTGRARGVAPDAVEVGGVHVLVAPGAEVAAPPDRPALVVGRWDAERGRIEGARVAPAFGRMRALSLEGYVQRQVGPARYLVGGVEVDAADLPSPAALRPDARVRVRGRMGGEGVLRVERVDTGAVPMRPRGAGDHPGEGRSPGRTGPDPAGPPDSPKSQSPDAARPGGPGPAPHPDRPGRPGAPERPDPPGRGGR